MTDVSSLSYYSSYKNDEIMFFAYKFTKSLWIINTVIIIFYAQFYYFVFK